MQKKADSIDISELVMSTEQFQTYARTEFGKETWTWKEDMLPKISDVVWRSLKTLQET